MTISIFKENAILYKETLTIDNVNLGYVVAVEYSNIIVISKVTKQEYKIPKSRIIRYNDTEILLDILSCELDVYSVN